ncbi:MAG: hypothetical protein HY788_21630 [Deltaproteobacteria bacterium]|nr:hypothetical protein [Deltaproteobacteria bacterium]
MFNPDDTHSAVRLAGSPIAGISLVGGLLKPLFRKRKEQLEEAIRPVPARKPAGPDLKGPAHYTFCSHPMCRCSSGELIGEVRKQAKTMGLSLTFEPTLTLCSGACSKGPFVGMPDNRVFYHGLKPRRARQLLEETSVKGHMLFPFLLLDPTTVADSRVYFDWRESVLVAMEPDYCVVSLVTYLFELNASESCGKCFPCRFGVHKLGRLLRELLAGRNEDIHIEEVAETAAAMSKGGYCEFAEKVTAPVRLALRERREDFERHRTEGCSAEERFLT